ncbi:MAG: hypothetical protein QMD04_04505 [Anaerolineales bacterium]|nr:hypothetical protein [Anaerolineales bacterium]
MIDYHVERYGKRFWSEANAHLQQKWKQAIRQLVFILAGIGYLPSVLPALLKAFDEAAPVGRL